MAFSTGPNGNGTVHELLFEWSTVVTPQAEICLVLADVQQKTSGGPVWLVTTKAVTVFHR